MKLQNECSLRELADFFGLTVSAADRAASAGLFVRSSRGCFDLKASAVKYTTHLRAIARNRGPVAEASIRLKNSTAALNDLKLKRLQGELVPADEARAAFVNFAREVRSHVLSIPSRFARIEGWTIELEMAAEDVVRELLQQMADKSKLQLTASSGSKGACDSTPGLAKKSNGHAEQPKKAGARVRHTG